MVVELRSGDHVSGIEWTGFVLAILVVLFPTLADVVGKLLRCHSVHRVVGTDDEFFWVLYGRHSG